MMTGRDDYADELLSAYLDGEVSFEEREQIVQRLARSAEYASRLEALRALQEALRALPRYHLAPEVETRIAREIARLAASSARPMTTEELEAELLSAYVDGEVSPEERQQVAQRLASSPAYASRLDALRALHQALLDLPRYRLSSAVEQRILRDIERLAAESADAAEAQDIEAELLSAYLDGEVSDAERLRVERCLADSALCRSQFEALRQLRAELQGLSTFHLDPGFADRVLQQIERETEVAEPTGGGPSPEVQPARGFATEKGHRPWRRLVWTALAVAAAVMLMVYFVPHRREPVRPLRSPLRLISRELLDRMVLVYDVAVTPEGVERGVFFQLLKRHGIKVLDAVPVTERDQRQLLSWRILEDVKLVSADTAAQTDEVRLYLVYCSLRRGDDMWFELHDRPQGFAAFFLNFTLRKAAGGVLPRLAHDAGLKEKMGQAAPLEGDFRVSDSKRRLGEFGKIRYIDPELLGPSVAPGESLLRESQERAATLPPEDPTNPEFAEQTPCEILFIVRNLRAPVAVPPTEAKPDAK